MIKNVFENKYAECLIARSKDGEAVGMALVIAFSMLHLMPF